MSTASERVTARRRRQLRDVSAINDAVSEREDNLWLYQRYPSDNFSGHWNLQRNDAEAFGYRQGFPLGGDTPLEMVRWRDGRTLWDEIRVLAVVFGG